MKHKRRPCAGPTVHLTDAQHDLPVYPSEVDKVCPTLRRRSERRDELLGERSGGFDPDGPQVADDRDCSCQQTGRDESKRLIARLDRLTG